MILNFQTCSGWKTYMITHQHNKKGNRGLFENLEMTHSVWWFIGDIYIDSEREIERELNKCKRLRIYNWNKNVIKQLSTGIYRWTSSKKEFYNRSTSFTNASTFTTWRYRQKNSLLLHMRAGKDNVL